MIDKIIVGNLYFITSEAALYLGESARCFILPLAVSDDHHGFDAIKCSDLQMWYMANKALYNKP